MRILAVAQIANLVQRQEQFLRKALLQLELPSLVFALVRAQAKIEAPLKSLAGGGGAALISTIADVTFYGKDQTGNDVAATGSISGFVFNDLNANGVKDAGEPGFRCSGSGRLALTERDCRPEGEPIPVLDVVDDAIEEALRQGVDVNVVFEPEARDAIEGLAGLLRFR